MADEIKKAGVGRDYLDCCGQPGDRMHLPDDDARLQSAFAVRWPAPLGDSMEITSAPVKISFSLMRRLLFTYLLLFAGLTPSVRFAQTEQALAKIDEKGNRFYEIAAASPNGSPGGMVVPLLGTKQWPRYITVTVGGYWMVADQRKGAHVNAEGRDIGGGSKPMPRPGPRDSFRLPSAPPFSLIGRWEHLDSRGGRVVPLSKLFYVGNGGKFRVPAKPQFARFDKVHIRYFCNDDLYTDNAGALRVYQSYSDQ
jgi:hypothetical protein